MAFYGAGSVHTRTRVNGPTRMIISTMRTPAAYLSCFDDR